MVSLHPDALVGRIIAGRYELLACVGRGGMGAVYSARHLAMKRVVAVKVLHGELSDDATLASRFEREAQLASVLSSPRIVTLFDFGREADGMLFLVMELLEGETLGERLRRAGAVPCSQAIDLGIAVTEALVAAHAKGIVHRDLKPENIMLTREGPKVLDFGIARILESDLATTGAPSSLTQAGQMVGTPMYMSPEAVARKPVGPAADLYALGCVLFEAIAGHPPFQESEPVLVMGMHLRVPAELLGAVCATPVPAGLEDLVDQLLAKTPEERPASAEIVLRELRRLASEPLAPRPTHTEPVPARPLPADASVAAPTPVPATGSRRRITEATAALSTLVAILVIGAWWAWPRETPPTATPTVPASGVPSPPPDDSPAAGPISEPTQDAVLAQLPVTSPATAPDQVDIRLAVTPASARVTDVRWGDATIRDLARCTEPTCDWSLAFRVDRDSSPHRLTVRAERSRAFEADITPSEARFVLVTLPRVRRPGHREPEPGRSIPSLESAFGGATR